ncbi:hypothetical protein QJS04_geneDACA010170 [Acorus gramineus]|uniref:O-fucosyltransferase family protein n=1 Tax=Acorus gramineus TaxID=55184 RepID=A0AAV9A5R2_ACOGR|nr:hypothetical protein QJS04_geneDACA010170 [Acorus gramineus]
MRDSPTSPSINTASDPLGQSLVKLLSNVCFSAFVLSVLIFTVIAITYHPPDPWLESSAAISRDLSRILPNSTFQTDDSLLTTGEDLNSSSTLSPPADLPPAAADLALALAPAPSSAACDGTVNCSDPRVLSVIRAFNAKTFRTIAFLEYGGPVDGSVAGECDVAWRFRNRKEKSWRRYRDFRRFRIAADGENCAFRVVSAGRWHSGANARRPRPAPAAVRAPVVAASYKDEEINDTLPSVGSEATFKKGKYLYYSRGGDYCKSMNHYMWSFLCGLGEAMYLNRTFVMDLSVCLSGSYSPQTWKDEEGKDFRYYFDFEHLKESASVVEEGEFLKDWKAWGKNSVKVPVRKVVSYKTTPMQLKRDKSTIIWRQFDGPEPENYWYRVCEGRVSKYVHRPWHAVWKSKHLMNIVSEISGKLDWDFDAVHVVRGWKARKTEMYPNLDKDTSPDALVAKILPMVKPWRHLYIATNEPFYNYFDKLRSHYHVHLLDDYKELWGNKSQWYNETRELNKGNPVEFDGYMRVEVDTEVLYRAKTRVETFNNLTRDCKDGVNTC